MLYNAKQGYYYQDILSAYLVAREIYNRNFDSEFLFDKKKTKDAKNDKFDDISVFNKQQSVFYQIKYSDETNAHKLTKADFSETGKYDLALQTLYGSWNKLKDKINSFKICLAWGVPSPDDEILEYIVYNEENSLFPTSKIFHFDINKIWPQGGCIVSKWKSLKNTLMKIKSLETNYQIF